MFKPDRLVRLPKVPSLKSKLSSVRAPVVFTLRHALLPLAYRDRARPHVALPDQRGNARRNRRLTERCDD